MTTPPTGPLTDHEIAQLLFLPEHYNSVRATREIVKWRVFAVQVEQAIEDSPGTALIRIRLALDEARRPHSS